MAANWIKIEAITPDKVEVAKLAESLNLDDPDYVLGKLLRFWIWADSNTRDGVLPVKFSHIDRIVYCPGFARALVSVGWLQGREGRLVIPNFDRHCSNSAKARALEAEAKRLRRSGKDLSDGESDIMSDESPTQCPTTVRHNVRPDKIREENKEETVLGRVTQPSVLAADAEPWPATPQEVMDFASSLPLTERPRSAFALERSCLAFQDWLADPANRRKAPDWRRKLKSWLRQDALREAEREAAQNPKSKKKDDYRL